LGSYQLEEVFPISRKLQNKWKECFLFPESSKTNVLNDFRIAMASKQMGEDFCDSG